MAAFLYFIPNAVMTSVASIPEDTGLRAILGQGSLTANAGTKFVVDGHIVVGSLLAMPNDSADQILLRQDEQEWQPVFNKPVRHGGRITHWIGYWKSSPPTPFDLQRADLVDGSALKLGEHEWVVPVIHPALEETFPASTLPAVLRMTSEGPAFETETKYRDLQNESVRFFLWAWELCSVPEHETEAERKARVERAPSDQDSLAYFARVMSVNYRMGLWEMSALGMVDTSKVADLIFYSLGLKQRVDEIEAQKKRPTLGPSSATS